MAPKLPEFGSEQSSLDVRVAMLERLAADTRSALERMEQRFNQIDARLESIGDRFDEIDRRLVRVDKPLDSSKFDDQVMSVRLDVAELKGGVSQLPSTMHVLWLVLAFLFIVPVFWRVS